MDKKEAIRLAAIKVIAKDGFYSTRMSSIADEAGIAIGTLYLYFKNKDDILDYIFEYEYERKIKYVQDLNASGMPFLQQIHSFIVFHLDIFKHNPDTAKVIMQECINPALQELIWIKKTNTDIPNIFKTMLENAKSNGEINDNIDPDIIGSMIFMSIRSLAYKLQREGREDEYDYAIEQFIKSLNIDI